MTTTRIDLTDASRARGGSDPLHARVTAPAGAGPFPAVILIHEVFGWDANMQAHSERLAALGYLVVAPELYSQGGVRRCLVATMRALRAGIGRAFTDIETAHGWATAQPDVTDRVGIIGFCMGGGFALLSADADRYVAASVNYGSLPGDEAEAYEGLCPVVGTYGADDRSLKGAAAALDAKLTEAGVQHDVREYAGAGHAFLNPGAAGPRLLRPLMRVIGVGGPVEATEPAWGRIADFFAAHLEPGEGPEPPGRAD